MRIHLYKRYDGSSLDYVGQRVFDQIVSNKFHCDLRSCNTTNTKKAKPAEIGIVYGLIRDIHWLKRYSIRIAGLVCEALLTNDEIEKIHEAKLDQIWVPSNFCKDLFNKAGFDNVKIVPHGVDKFKVREKHVCNNSLLMVFNSYPRLTFTTSRKGVFEAIKAVENTDINLILRTKKQSYYSKHNLKNITFVEDRIESLEALYHYCDAILCPSYTEGFGLIGLEALACGVPLISTKTGNDYLKSNISYVETEFPPSSTNILSSINNFYSNFELYTELATSQANKIQEYWSWDNAGNIISNILSDYLIKKPISL